jgi:hypothetical protein
MNSKPTFFLDMDGVMVTERQLFDQMHPEFHLSYFDPECVQILNEILSNFTDFDLILSSDYRYNYEFDIINKAFKEYGVNGLLSDITPNLWGVRYKSYQQLEECRAEEILAYVKEHELTNWVAIDDLNLSPWIPDNFARCTDYTLGIKQSGVKDKILKILI